MRIVAMSDTHGLHHSVKVPDGDVLIHAGDFSNYGTLSEVIDFTRWLERLPHQIKIIVAGNHDWSFQREPGPARSILTEDPSIAYLQDDPLEHGGFHFYGSPWQPWFHDWAFNAERGTELALIWGKIPTGLDVLVTHGPPYGILDETVHHRIGCADLKHAVAVKKPRVHIFGHNHSGFGRRGGPAGTRFYNVALVNEEYRIVRNPVTIHLDPPESVK